MLFRSALVEAGGYQLQAEPPRQLPRLGMVPTVVVTSEASVFTESGPQLVAFLRQAGCRAEHLALVDHGIHGNSHGIMFERNHAEVLDVVLEWVSSNLA